MSDDVPAAYRRRELTLEQRCRLAFLEGVAEHRELTPEQLRRALARWPAISAAQGRKESAMFDVGAEYEKLIDELNEATGARGAVIERFKAKLAVGEPLGTSDPIHAEWDVAIAAERAIEDRIRAFVARYGRR